MDSLCCVRNKIMYVHLWRTVSALTRVLFWCLFPSLRINTKITSRERWNSSSLEYIHYSLYLRDWFYIEVWTTWWTFCKSHFQAQSNYLYFDSNFINPRVKVVHVLVCCLLYAKPSSQKYIGSHTQTISLLTHKNDFNSIQGLAPINVSQKWNQLKKYFDSSHKQCFLNGCNQKKHWKNQQK